MFSPLLEDEPTSVLRILGDFSSRLRASSSTGSLLKRRESAQQKLHFLDDEDEGDESSLSKVPRFHDPLSSALGRKRFASERLAQKGQDEETATPLGKLKLELISKDVEILEAKAYATKLEDRISQLEMGHRKSCLELENEISNLKRERRNQKEKADQALRELNAFKSREKRRIEDESMSLRSTHQTRYNLEDKCNSLTKENIRLTESLNELRQEMEAVRRDRDGEVAALRREVEALKSEIEESDRTRSRDEQRREKISSLKTELENVKIQLVQKDQEVLEMKDELQQNEDAIVQRNAMREKLAAYPKLVSQIESLRKENRLLTETMDNSRLLKEQIEDLQNRLAHSEQMCQQNMKAKYDLANVHRTLKEWESICLKLLTKEERDYFGTDGTPGPEVLSQKLAEIQRSELLLKSQIGEMNSKINEFERVISRLENENRELNSLLKGNKENMAEQSKLIKRFQRKLLLTSKERDSYKNLLDSYEHEVTFTGSQLEKDRINALEKIVADHKEMIEKLEKHVAGAATPAVVDITVDNEKIQELETQLASATAKLAEVAKQLQDSEEKREELKYELDRRAMKGDYDPTDTKVLHFRQNPAAEAFETFSSKVTALENENQSLKARVKLLEEGQSKDLTLLVGQKVNEGLSSKEVQELKDQLKAADLRIQRLMEAFKKTSQEFREVCYRLTGYRIDVLQNNRYRLMSVYAESPEDQLLFERGSDGEILLLETAYMSTLSELIDLHLTTQNSIPMFLSALTMELFSRQTFETTSMTVDEQPPSETQELEQPESQEEAHEIIDDNDVDDDDPICID